MIKIKNLVKKYGQLTAVNDLSLEIFDGEIFALLGLNGAGKSTLIKVLCSLIDKTEGKVFVNGMDLDENRQKIKSILNLSPQETAVANNLTVKENLELIATLYGISNSSEAADKMIEKVSLQAKKDARAKTLSGGQKRRLSIAMALITSPEILILDEPTLGLDIKSRRELWNIIEGLSGNTTVILTTHYLEEARNLAERIAIMNKGSIVALGTAQEIISQSQKNSFEDAFLALTGGEDE